MAHKTANTLATPAAGSLYLEGMTMAWEKTELEGYWLKRLHEDTERGEKTWLMRMDPGARVGPHAHDGEIEQVYVLEGSFEDNGQTLTAGDYVCRAPGAIHGGSSAEGALVLLMFSRLEPHDRAI